MHLILYMSLENKRNNETRPILFMSLESKRNMYACAPFHSQNK